MKVTEEALVFPLADENLLGILAQPDVPADCGVLIVVGGPQYRVGSHRQFLLLARRLAAAGYPSLRFDVRGMGDSDGAMRSFEQLDDDIGAAIAAFRAACPTLRRIVLWGLCDAASAALIYVGATRDPAIAGLVLLNPWAHSETSLARTHIKHYYAQRLLRPDFWAKLLRGRLHWRQSLRNLWSSARAAARHTPGGGDQRPYQEKMAAGWRQFGGPLLLVLSGEDYTAKEFLEYAAASPAWTGLLAEGRVTRVDLPQADHTFSSAAWRAMVEEETLAWLKRLP